MFSQQEGGPRGRFYSRTCLDYSATSVRLIKERLCRPELSPSTPLSLVSDAEAIVEMLPPSACAGNPTSSACLRHVHTSLGKDRSGVNAICWTPDGRRLLSASHNGMFTLW